MITLFVPLGDHFQYNVLDGRWSQSDGMGGERWG